MRRGDFSELLSARTGFFSTPQIIRNPATGQPFANNVIPQGMLSRNGIAIMNLYPLPTPGFQGTGSQNAVIESDNPQDQRKDNIRFDYRLNDNNQFNYRYPAIELGGHRCVPRRPSRSPAPTGNGRTAPRTSTGRARSATP